MCALSTGFTVQIHETGVVYLWKCTVKTSTCVFPNTADCVSAESHCCATTVLCIYLCHLLVISTDTRKMVDVPKKGDKLCDKERNPE